MEMKMHESPESTPIIFHPALSVVGFVWGAGNVLMEVARGGPSFLSVLGPILIGSAAFGTLLFNIYKYAIQQREARSALQAELAAAKAELDRLKNESSHDASH
jgi:hypothetical protein